MSKKQNPMIEQLAELLKEYEKASGFQRMGMAERVGAVALGSLIKMAATIDELEKRLKSVEAANA